MKYMKLPKQARESLLEGLKQMPDFLAQSFARLPASLYAVPGPQGTFSPVEQAWHLADLEAMGFAERIRRLRAEQNPRLPDFAGEIVARERNYRSLPLIDGIAAFRQARDANLAALSAELKRYATLQTRFQNDRGQVYFRYAPREPNGISPGILTITPFS